MQHAVVEEQPTFRGLDGHGAGTNLHTLPGAHLKRGGSHHVAVVSPELHIRRLAVEDVAESGVAGVGRAGEHGELTANLTGEEHAVAVIGQEGVLYLVESLEVLGPGYADGRAMVAVAPGNPVAVFDEGHAGVIPIDPLAHFGIGPFKLDGVGLDVPVHTVLGEAGVEGHAAVGIVAAEYACKAVPERDHGAVEDAVGVRKQVPGNHGIGTIAPQRGVATGRTVFPRHAREGFSGNSKFCHICCNNSCMVWSGLSPRGT